MRKLARDTPEKGVLLRPLIDNFPALDFMMSPPAGERDERDERVIHLINAKVGNPPELKASAVLRVLAELGITSGNAKSGSLETADGQGDVKVTLDIVGPVGDTLKLKGSADDRKRVLDLVQLRFVRLSANHEAREALKHYGDTFARALAKLYTEEAVDEKKATK